MSWYKMIKTSSLYGYWISPNGEEFRIDADAFEAFEFTISGYEPLREWLKWHQVPYLNRKFKYEDAKRLILLIHRIKKQLAIQPELDEEVVKLFSVEALL